MKFNKIATYLNLEKNNSQIIKFGFELCKLLKAEITFINCYQPNAKYASMGEEELEALKLEEINTLVSKSNISYETINFECLAYYDFSTEGIIQSIEDESFDMLIIGSSQKESFLFSNNIAFDLLDQISIPAIIVPEQFRLVDLDVLVFNIEFEFNEINSIYNLLSFAEEVNANLSCIHVCDPSNNAKANKHLNTYKRIFSQELSDLKIDFEILNDEKFRSIEKFAIENEVDLIVLGKTRKTWKNQYFKTAEEKLGAKMNIPVMVLNIN